MRKTSIKSCSVWNFFPLRNEPFFILRGFLFRPIESSVQTWLSFTVALFSLTCQARSRGQTRPDRSSSPPLHPAAPLRILWVKKTAKVIRISAAQDGRSSNNSPCFANIELFLFGLKKRLQKTAEYIPEAAESGGGTLATRPRY